MIAQILALFANIAFHLFRRGRGIFKFLFIIDDFFRIFTMTILIPIFFRWLKFGEPLLTMGVILGIIIDLHDFISEYGIAKIDEEKIFSSKK